MHQKLIILFEFKVEASVEIDFGTVWNMKFNGNSYLFQDKTLNNL